MMQAMRERSDKNIHAPIICLNMNTSSFSYQGNVFLMVFHQEAFFFSPPPPLPFTFALRLTANAIRHTFSTRE